MAKPDYDTTIARMAGNIAAGFAPRVVVNKDWTLNSDLPRAVASISVEIARAIVAEVKRTAPKESEQA